MFDIRHEIETLDSVGRRTHCFIGIVTCSLCASRYIAGFICIALLSDVIVTLWIIIVTGTFGKAVVLILERIYASITTINISGITFTFASDTR